VSLGLLLDEGEADVLLSSVQATFRKADGDWEIEGEAVSLAR
jgi:hypothetical protein